MAFEDDSLTVYEKQAVMLNNLFVDDAPSNLSEAFEKANWFLNGGESVGEEKEGDATRLYSFSKDANFIFAAFRQTHGIDLQSAKLHWWTFLALFMDLGKDTTFSNLIGLRKRVSTGKATKVEQQAARDMGNMFEIEQKDTRTTEEKQAYQNFMDLHSKGLSR